VDNVENIACKEVQERFSIGKKTAIASDDSNDVDDDDVKQ